MVVSTVKETAFRFLTSKGIYKNNMSSVFWSASAQSPIKKLIFLNYIRLDLPTGPFVFDLVGWKPQNFFKTKNIPRTHPQVWFYLFTCSYVTKESDSKLNEEIIIKPTLISEKHVNLQKLSTLRKSVTFHTILASPQSRLYWLTKNKSFKSHGTSCYLTQSF